MGRRARVLSNKRWLFGLTLLTLGALLVLTLRDTWVVGLIVRAPSPSRQSTQRPSDVGAVIDVERFGARLRGWIFEPRGRPRGTVLVLHGIRSSKASQLATARRLARLGFRAVAMDLRGHGDSSGRWLSYGVHDAKDLSAVLDRLDERSLLAQPVGVLGTSYGAATALLLAGQDERIRTTVAIAPFASLREVVPNYLDLYLGSLAALVPDAFVEGIVDEAGRQAHFDPDAASPDRAAAHIEGSVLLVHGREDRRIPKVHSEQIQTGLRHRHRLDVIDGVGHDGIAAAPGVTQAVDRWLLEELERVTPIEATEP